MTQQDFDKKFDVFINELYKDDPTGKEKLVSKAIDRLIVEDKKKKLVHDRISRKKRKQKR